MTKQQIHYSDEYTCYWELMSFSERVGFVSVLFSEANRFDVVYHSTEPVYGWDGWYRMEWAGV